MKKSNPRDVDSYIANPDKFDLILMDCEMPIMDGFKATNKIRQWEHNNNRENIVIIALTAHAHESYLDKITDCGMNSCIIKPISAQALGERLEEANIS